MTITQNQLLACLRQPKRERIPLDWEMTFCVFFPFIVWLLPIFA